MKTRTPRTTGKLRLAGFVVTGLALGVLAVPALVFVERRLGGASEYSLEGDGPSMAVVEFAHEGPGGASPAEAVALFLDAEANDDAAASYRMLTLRDQEHFAAPEVWASARASTFGDLRSWAWATAVNPAGAEPLKTELVLSSSISLAGGIQPPNTSVDWVVVDEDGWRVSLAESTVEPHLPSDQAAVQAVGQWLQDCDEPQAPDGYFLGSRPSAQSAACDAGLVDVDEPVLPPTGRVAADLVVAFGPSATGLTRTITLAEPPGVTMVVAPLGSGWTVVDVVDGS